jgi:hypothetical protein
MTISDPEFTHLPPRSRGEVFERLKSAIDDMAASTPRRHPSAIRTGCANERSSGSEEGVVSDHDPYSDRQ